MNESSTPRWHDLQRRLAEAFGTEANSNPAIGAKSPNSRQAPASSHSWLVRARSGAIQVNPPARAPV